LSKYQQIYLLGTGAVGFL